MLTIFAYGTLKPGEAGFQRYCEPYVALTQPAYSQGQLFHLPQGYPAMTTGDRWVQGALLYFRDAEMMPYIDDFEDYDPTRPDHENLYIRHQRPVFGPDHQPLGLAWTYLMAPHQVEALAGVIVTSNVWSQQQWPSIAAVPSTFNEEF